MGEGGAGGWVRVWARGGRVVRVRRRRRMRVEVGWWWGGEHLFAATYLAVLPRALYGKC